MDYSGRLAEPLALLEWLGLLELLELLEPLVLRESQRLQVRSVLG